MKTPITVKQKWFNRKTRWWMRRRLSYITRCPEGHGVSEFNEREYREDLRLQPILDSKLIKKDEERPNTPGEELAAFGVFLVIFGGMAAFLYIMITKFLFRGV